VEQRAICVDRSRAVAREELEREECRAARRGALVLEPSPEELQLLAVPELPDRAVGDGAFAKIGAPRRPFDLVGPLGAQLRELALGTRDRQLVGLGSGCGQLRQRTASAPPARCTAPRDG
jgi:hypothetical protein